jgi:hypothetical protein
MPWSDGVINPQISSTVSYVTWPGFEVTALAQSDDGLSMMYLQMFYPDSNSTLVPIRVDMSSTLPCGPWPASESSRKGCGNYFNFGQATRTVSIDAGVLKALPNGRYRIQAQVRGYVSNKYSDWTDITYLTIQNK